MPRHVRIVFLVNSSSNKSRTVIEHFSNEWPFPSIDIGFVIDDATGTAARAVRKLPHPTCVCADGSDIEDSIRTIANRIGGCDYLISAGWANKVPDSALSLPDTAALNVHSSYLPEYRGLSVHRAQWANAERTGGVTVHRMTSEFDKGDIIIQQRYRIGLFDTPLSMNRTIGVLSAALTREAILLIEHGYEGQPQGGDGDYYGLLPWRMVLFYGVINHLLRLVGTERRIEAPSQT